MLEVRGGFFSNGGSMERLKRLLKKEIFIFIFGALWRIGILFDKWVGCYMAAEWECTVFIKNSAITSFEIFSSLHFRCPAVPNFRCLELDLTISSWKINIFHLKIPKKYRNFEAFHWNIFFRDKPYNFEEWFTKL